MHSVTFLQDLAVVMLVAGMVTVIFHRFKQPVVLGYIIAGVIIGPHTPPFPLIHDKETINTLAELGVILLMFSLGLEFNLRKLTQVGMPALIAALLEILLLFWVGYGIGRFFSWPLLDSIFLGAMLSMSSTTVIIKILGELGKMKERFAQLIFGILIIEDILGIAMIALLSGIAMTGQLTVGDVGLTLGKLGIFLVVTLVVGLIVVPRLIGYVARFKSNEMLIITVLGLCFGVSLLAAKLGNSVALGAFIIGAVIAEAREIHRVETLLEPVRDMFSAIFFVAIGLLIDPKTLITYWQPILVITLAVIVGKVLTCSVGAFVGGNDTRTSLRVGMGLAQIGEFSFIIASLGVTLNVTSGFLYPIVVAVSAITTLLTPYLIKSADGAVSWFDRVAPKPLVHSLDIYTRWIAQLGEQRHANQVRKLIRRWFAQMALNLVLVAAIFITAAFVAEKPPQWLLSMLGGTKGVNAALWLCATLLSLPLLVATYRKLQALGLLLGEISARRIKNRNRATGIQTVINHTVPLAGVIGMGLLLLVFSAALLPSWKILGVLLLVVIAVTVLLWRSLIRIYSKAQIALEGTFAQPQPPRHELSAPLAGVLKEARTETVVIAATSPAKNKLIRELALRTQTGASIVAIERAGVNLVNPGPDEELHADDQVLLLGSKQQLDKARRHMLGQ
ncbi:MAG: cation:proton antiporter [Verrucomicrobiia bacterium]